MDVHKTTVAQDLGLTPHDIGVISAAQCMIPWPISYDFGDRGELYAIINAPESGRGFAFLLDREDGRVVLTDNFTHPRDVVVTAYPDLEAAAAHVSLLLLER